VDWLGLRSTGDDDDDDDDGLVPVLSDCCFMPLVPTFRVTLNNATYDFQLCHCVFAPIVVTNYTVTLRIIELIEIIQLIEYPVLFFVSLAVNLFFLFIAAILSAFLLR